MRIFNAVCVALLITGTSYCSASSPRSTPSDDDTASLVSNFSVANKTAVPGTTLKPGSYSIQVVDHLSDRVVLRIMGPNGKVLTTFLGLPNGSMQGAGANGPVAWGSGPKGEDALRGFSFPGGSVEFVYPKEEAVAIAKVNSGKVAAIDPASQGMPTEPGKLTKDDMQIVNLWLLSTTHVGPPNASEAAVQAERYQAQQPVQVASTQPAPAAAVPAAYTPAPPAQPARVRAPRPAPAASQQVASNRHATQLAALPHTASDLPAIFLASILALFGACLVRRVRLSGNAS